MKHKQRTTNLLTIVLLLLTALLLLAMRQASGVSLAWPDRVQSITFIPALGQGQLPDTVGQDTRKSTTASSADAFDFPVDPPDGGTRPPWYASYNQRNPYLGPPYDTREWSNCYGKWMSELQHAGEDWFRGAGTSVHSVANGRVIYIADDWDHGDAIVIEHTLPSGWSNSWGGPIIYSVYLHVNSSVAQWQDVTKGQVISSVFDWSSNSHLHLEMRRYGDMSNVLVCPVSGSSSWIGPSYTDTDVDPGTFGYTDPSDWIDSHRSGGPSPPSCPPENCMPGNEVGRDFFVEVLERLADVPVSDFAVDALILWKPYENTDACWNPLATTWIMEFRCDYNWKHVQSYQSQDMGTQATVNTLAQGCYDNIRRMLRLEEFNREGLRTDLDVWGTCSGQGCDSLLNEWEALWIAHGGPSHADLKQCSDLTISPSNPQVDQTVTFCFDVCNDGDQSVTFQNIGPQGHGPPDGQGGLWNEFAHNITVGAGQRVTVCPSRSFEWEGTWCIEHVPTQDQDGNWQDLPANGYRQAQCFGVGSVTPTPGDGATLYENENYGGQSETFTSDDGYLGDNPIRSDRASSVRVRGTYFTTLYEHPDYAGTAESFHYDDPNLSDNHIGNDTVSSLRVYPAVALYEHSNFGGKCETFVSNQANLSGTYIAQDTVSSIKIPSCYEVTLYEHPNYEGRSEFFTDDDSSLSNNHIGNDVVSSIKIERIVPDGITLFEHENFVGRNRTFTSDNSNLPSEYVDMASSVKIRGPFMAAVYEHPDYGGTGETFDYDDPDLRDNHIGSDTISSMRVWPAAALYEHSNYRGRCQTFDRDDGNLSGSYIEPDTASSLKVPIGYLVTLCEHPNFEGACQTFTGNNSDLRKTDVGNDTVSSLTVAAIEDYDAENGGTLAEFWVEPGESFDVTISVRNNGDAIWRRIHQVRLGLLTWNDRMGIGDLRRDLDSGESVASGAIRSWTVRLTAPTTPGTYWQGWEMLREDGHVGWFGDLIRFEVHVRNLGVTLYEDANYAGESEFFDSDDPDLSNNAIGEDITSSIWIEEDYWAILFRDRSFQGNYEIFDSSDPDLADNLSIGNDSASSIKVGQGEPPPWALFGDFNWDCVVDVADIQQVASRWRMTDDDPDWDVRYDLNGDGIITVVDIMLVAAHWDERCE